MRIKHVHIENFRCLQHLDVDVQTGVNLLIGENNTGKSAFLHALNQALGRGASFEVEDFFVEDPNAGIGALKPIRIDLELRPTPAPTFSAAFVTEFADEIDFDAAGAPYLMFRTQASFDMNEGAIRVEFAAIKSDGTARAMSARKRFALRGFIPFYMADAFRDTVRELRTRRGFWGQLIDSALLDAGTEAAVTQALKDINDSILANTPRFSEIRERFREIGRVIPTVPSPDDVVLNPLTADPAAVLKNPEILLRTMDAPRGFALDRHGEGTRSVGYLVIFRAFVDLLAKEENDNMEAEPVLGIEEPEAHLHLHARRGIANVLSEPDKQAFITSHSTAIAQRVPVDSITLFRRDGAGCVATQAPMNAAGGGPLFEPRERTTLQRELRSGAAEALFSRAVLLFEGESEVRALPFFASAAGIELDLRGISFVSVDGQAFSPMLRLFGSQALKIPWVILSLPRFPGHLDCGDLFAQGGVRDGYEVPARVPATRGRAGAAA